jgi:hydroxymethylbilane synthase
VKRIRKTSGHRCLASLKLGTRASLLARMQSQLIADALERAHPGLKVELVLVQTGGDRIQDRALHDFGGKGLFTKELEEALLDHTIDIAVHSYKDVPVTQPLVAASATSLVIAAVPPREDPRDVLASVTARRLADLPRGATVGTGSLRRRCQILARRPDLVVERIRGNVDTRLRKLCDDQFDAIILAAAGLRRSSLFDAATMSLIDVDEMIPAAAQGALAIQCRADDAATRALVEVLDDPKTARCVAIERAVVQSLDGDCHSPIAALASEGGESLNLIAAVGAKSGERPVIVARARGAVGEGDRMLRQVVEDLVHQGARDLLSGRRNGRGLDRPCTAEGAYVQ